jgi:hypothetical protein
MGGDRFNPNNGELQSGLSRLDKAKYNIMRIMKMYRGVFDPPVRVNGIEIMDYYTIVYSVSFTLQTVSFNLNHRNSTRCILTLNINDISCDFYSWQSYEGIIIRFPTKKYVWEAGVSDGRGGTTYIKEEKTISQMIFYYPYSEYPNNPYGADKLKVAFDELVRLTKSQKR